ncbi:MAG: type II toxin-antitoxin system VapC family toxin [Nocardioidaceae bacterium]
MTSISASGSSCLLDTSAAVAFLVSDHTQHDLVFEALTDRELGLAGHAAFETFSVLTRLPAANRLSPRTAVELIESNFPHTRYLSPKKTGRLLASFSVRSIAGGSVYDALVGAAAAEHGLPLATRDLRAVRTYRQLDVDIELLS